MSKGGIMFSSVLAVVVLLALVAASCAPAAPLPTPPPAATSMPAPTAPGVMPSPAPGVTPPPTAVVRAPTLTPVPAAPVPEKPRYGGVLTVSLAKAEPPHFDMHQHKHYSVQQPLAPIYNGLLTNDSADYTKIVPDLAERWEISPDGKLYTFYLRKGVKFHDGTPFTSADAKVSFDRQIFPPKGILSPRKDLFLSVEKIEAPDANTVKFYLKFPQASFLTMVALPFSWVFPKHILDAKGDMKKDINGTGPFKLKEYIRGVSFEYLKNPDYFLKDRPYLDGIMRYVIMDPTAIHAAFRAHRILLLPEIGHDLFGPELELVKKELPQVVVETYVATSQYYFFPNHKRKPWDDIRVRRAVDLAFDRQAFIQVMFKGSAAVGGHMMPGPWAIPAEELLKMPGYRPEKEADIAAAKKLLAEAGYPKGFKTTINTHADRAHQERGIVVAKNQLALIGIDATIQLLELGAFYARREAGDFDVESYGATVAAPEPDVVFGEQYVSSAVANWGRYSNPKIDELYGKQMRTIDPAERKKMIRQMEQILMEDVARVVYHWKVSGAIYWPEVKGFVNKPGWSYGVRLQDVWLAQ